jgi:GMP synthase (glutamine-hydrolysing)
MKILIIDNNSKHIEKIKELCKDNIVEVLKYSDDLVGMDRNYDLVILSGGTGLPINKKEKELMGEINLIKNSTKPIIGICLGFELICHAFDCKMIREEEREKGIVEINILNDEYFLGKKKLKVLMAHKWHVREVGPEIIPLAQTSKGIDIIKHKSRPIYGFQFHPEIIEPENDGKFIFEEVFNLLTRN